MIDVRQVLADFENLAQQLAIKKVDSEILANLRNLAADFKSKKQELEALQAFQNKVSKEFGELNKKLNSKTIMGMLLKDSEGDVWEEQRANLKKQLDDNKIKLADSENQVRISESKLNELLLTIPNLPDERTPKGNDENDNIEISLVLEPKNFDFKPLEHWELAAKNGWIDFEAGVKLAKSRFSVLRGFGAKLNRALINFMLDFNEKQGFEPVVTPVIVNRNCLLGTGQLPKFEDDMFRIAKQSSDEDDFNDLFLISTSEITLTNLYNDTIIKESRLPICLTAQTPCFRKEAGSAGRDTRGMIRQHQFDKVELVAITKPLDSEKMQEKMVSCASGILSALGLPHRLVQLCGGDLGFSAANTIDIEVWLPGQNCYREISSVSNCRDFQARRAKIRYKDEKGKNQLVHTLNGSSLAVGRTLIAIMENYQNADGSIEIPEVLKKYL